MGRVYFQRAAAGYRGVRGDVIRNLQERLTALDQDTRGLDGIYGQDTEAAVRGFQGAKGLTPSGQIDADTWKELMATPMPGLFDRCIRTRPSPSRW